MYNWKNTYLSNTISEWEEVKEEVNKIEIISTNLSENDLTI